MESLEDYRRIDGNDVRFLGKHQDYEFNMYIVSNVFAAPIILAECGGMTAEGGDQDQAAGRLCQKRIQAAS